MARRLARLAGVLVGGSPLLGAMPVCLSYSKGADLARAAAPYVAVRAMALPAALIASVAQAACLGLRDATTPGLSVAIAASQVNMRASCTPSSRVGSRESPTPARPVMQLEQANTTAPETHVEPKIGNGEARG